jgi:hypothetical protein
MTDERTPFHVSVFILTTSWKFSKKCLLTGLQPYSLHASKNSEMEEENYMT